MQKIEVSLQSEKNNGHFAYVHKYINTYVVMISLSVLLRMINVSGKKL
jgi:hypothetical protein